MTDFDTFFTEIQDAPGEIFDMDFDDLMTADDFDRRRAMRDGWVSDTEGRW